MCEEQPDTDDAALEQLQFRSSPRYQNDNANDEPTIAAAPESSAEAATNMYDQNKDIPPPRGIPDRWLKLLHKTHEVSSRISQTIKRAIEHGDDQLSGRTGSADRGQDLSSGSYRAIEPTDM